MLYDQIIVIEKNLNIPPVMLVISFPFPALKFATLIRVRSRFQMIDKNLFQLRSVPIRENDC